MEGGCDGRLVGQTGILALDGVRMLVGVAAVVVATSVARRESAEFISKRNSPTKSKCFLNCF